MTDPISAAWLLIALFVLLSYTTEAMTGFGSIVIALSLGALVLPLGVLMPVLVPLNILMSGYLTLRYRGQVQWRLLLAGILPLMAAGTLLGYLGAPWLGQSTLKLLFGVLIVAFSVPELWRLRSGLAPPAHAAWWSRGWMLGAGVTHGLFASGGPMLVYALSGADLDKTRFRATLIAVWFTLNSLLTLSYALDGSLVPALPRVALLAPVVVLGVILGETLHHRVDEARFRGVLFSVLLLAGLALVVRSL